MLKLKLLADNGDELYSQCLIKYMWLICYFFLSFSLSDFCY